MSPTVYLSAKISLSILWVFTGVTSLVFAKDTGIEILLKGGFTLPLAETALHAGAMLDIGIGVWVLTHVRLTICYWAQLIVIATYTVLLSFIDPEFWLHPFGPVTKNFPIMVLIYLMCVHEASLAEKHEAAT